MPWESDKQRRWGNSPAGVKAMGQAKVNEFNQASKGMSLPKKVVKQKTKYSGSPHITAAQMR